MDIGIVLGSTRPGRKGLAVATWVHELATARADARYALVDVADAALPFYDEPLPAARGRYEHEHTRRWSATIAPLDAFVIVTAEYNHGVPAALKNALDFLYAEWNEKAVGFVSYGSAGGVRAVEHLRGIVAELRMADVRAQVTLSTATDFDADGVFTPGPGKDAAVHVLLDQLVPLAGAMATLRTER